MWRWLSQHPCGQRSGWLLLLLLAVPVYLTISSLLESSIPLVCRPQVILNLTHRADDMTAHPENNSLENGALSSLAHVYADSSSSGGHITHPKGGEKLVIPRIFTDDVTKYKKSELLLVTFGRSGSSFTSRLISQDPSVFYSFEPLYVLQAMHNGTTVRLSLSNSTETAFHILRAFLTCDFVQLNATYLNNVQLRNGGPAMQQFFRCSRVMARGTHHFHCYNQLIKQCRQKTTIFTKVIRFPLAWAETLLRQMPNLKIIYLVRDPRAVLHSQAVVFRHFKWPQDLQAQAKLHCSQMAEDLAALERFSNLFPGRVLGIRYESGAEDPAWYTRAIYQFAGLNVTNVTLEHIRNVTHSTKAEKELSNAYSLMKSNSTAAANHWRQKVSFDSVLVVDKVCAGVYPRWGYRQVISPADLHSNIPLFNSFPMLRAGNFKP